VAIVAAASNQSKEQPQQPVLYLLKTYDYAKPQILLSPSGIQLLCQEWFPASKNGNKLITMPLPRLQKKS
jgi:hypothetical protein